MFSVRQWVIGRAPGCDIVVDDAEVSSRHCKLVETPDGALLEDLGSTNGTFLNGALVKSPVPVSRRDRVTLGLAVPLPWPTGFRTLPKPGADHVLSKGNELVVLGRDPGCDLVVDDAMVSRRHACLTLAGQQWILEDLGSTNGTYLNGKRCFESAEIRPGDTIGLGAHEFTLTADWRLRGGDCRGRVVLEARNVCVDVGGKRLVQRISLTILPAEFVGLMGPSGAGKTTLMNALNGYTTPNDGQVLFNGQTLHDHYQQFSRLIGYVPQDDIMHRDLTVRQALYYTARLRLPLDYSDREILERTRHVLDLLDLKGTENLHIGSPEKRGISGGQRKRVNLAMELLTDPVVLFLDEPTSGLSSEDALGVMKVLRGLADAGKTILLTLHQPSLEAYRLLDNLVVVARDKTVGAPGVLTFYGPAYPDAINFFRMGTSPNVQSSGELSPDDLFRRMAQQPASAWNATYLASFYYQDFVTTRAGKRVAQHPLPVAVTPDPRLPAGQWWTLVRRCLAIKAKDTGNTAVLLAQAPIVAVLLVAVFGAKCKTEITSENGLQVAGSVAVVLFLVGLSALWFGCSNAIREIVGERAIYQRERMVNLSIFAYLASRLTVLAGLCVVQCLTLLTIVHWGCGLRGPCLWLFAVLLLVALVGVALGLTLSALARTSEMGIALLPLVLLPMVILGGVLLPLKEMHQAASALTIIMPSRWAFQGMLLLESQNRPALTVPTPAGGDSEQRGFAEAYFVTKDYRLAFFVSIAALGCLFLILVSSSYVVLRGRDIHKQRIW